MPDPGTQIEDAGVDQGALGKGMQTTNGSMVCVYKNVITFWHFLVSESTKEDTLLKTNRHTSSI